MKQGEVKLVRILVVDDEVRLAEALAQILTENRYLVDTCHDGESGFDNAMSGIYDVIVLDVMLPKMDGFTVVKKMRQAGEKTPVILLTAKDEIPDKVAGLDSGADDYLTKPFSPEELLARVRALSRRPSEVLPNLLSFGDVTLDQSANNLSCGGRSVRLGLKEYEVMRLLLSNRMGVVPKEEILLKVWGAESDAEDNNVEVYISFLRKKLFFLGSHVTIETVRKLGYFLRENHD